MEDWPIMIPSNNRQDGFTLVEVLIAISLLVIGILAVASMQVSSLQGNTLANRVTEASTWSGDAIETLMSRPYDHADLVDDNADGLAGRDNTDAAGSPADGGPIVNGDFTVFWNVVDNSPMADCKSIRVLVRRTDRGTVRTVTMDFIKMRPI